MLKKTQGIGLETAFGHCSTRRHLSPCSGHTENISDLQQVVGCDEALPHTTVPKGDELPVTGGGQARLRKWKTCFGKIVALHDC